jgi:hypothetical protein
METVIQVIGTIIVAIIGLIGIIIQTKNHSRNISQEKLLAKVDKKIDAIRAESKRDDIKLNAKLDDIEMQNCKRFLIVELMKIKDNMYIPNEEQKRMLHETKKRYNSRGGDSYIDSMFDELVEKHIL